MQPTDEQQEPLPSRDELLRSHMGLVKQLARKMVARLPPNVELDDLIGAGMIGLIDAVDKFDQAKSSNFRKYAEIRVKGAILDELRTMDHVSRTVRRQTTALQRTVQGLHHELGRRASHEEVAAELGVDLSHYHELVDKLKPVMVMGFDDLTPKGEERGRDPLQYLPDHNSPDPQHMLHKKSLIERVHEGINALDEREQMVVRFYYFDQMTLKEIGKILGVTESRVSQMMSKAVKTLGRRISLQLQREGVGVPLLE